MPMRIIGRGRDAYVLAGYLYKKSRWSWQWTERYFVLTPSALHYYKKEKTQLFGEEKGHFLVEDMMVRPIPDKLSFEIFANQKSRMLRAGSEREYLAWARAFQDVQIKHSQHLRSNYSKDSQPSSASSSHHTHHHSSHHKSTRHNNQNQEDAHSRSSNAIDTANHNNSINNTDNYSGRHINKNIDINTKSTPSKDRRSHHHDINDNQSGQKSNLNVSNSNEKIRPQDYIQVPKRRQSEIGSHSPASASSSPLILDGDLFAKPNINRSLSGQNTSSSTGFINNLPTNNLSVPIRSYNTSVYSPQPSPLISPTTDSANPLGSNSNQNNSLTEPILLVTVEGASSSSSDAVGWLGGAAGPKGAELIAGRFIKWNHQLLVPGLQKGSVITALFADGTKIRIERDELKSNQGDKSITVVDPYRPINVRIRWNVVPTPILPSAQTRLLAQILPCFLFILFTILTLFYSSSISSSTYCLILSGLISAAQFLQVQYKKYTQMKAKKLWFITFVSCTEVALPNSSVLNSSINNHQPQSSPVRSGVSTKRSFSARDIRAENNIRASSSTSSTGGESADNSASNSDSDDSISDRDFKLDTQNRHDIPNGNLRQGNSSVRQRNKGGNPSSTSSNNNNNNNNNKNQLKFSRTIDSNNPSSHHLSYINTAIPNVPSHANNGNEDVSQQSSPVESAGSTNDDNLMLEISNNSAFETETEWPETITANNVKYHNNNNNNQQSSAAPDPISPEESYEDEKVTIENFKANILPPLTIAPWGSWTEPDCSQLKIRGPTFMNDKIKILCGPSLYRLAHCDMFHTGKDKLYHIAKEPHSFAYIRWDMKMKKMGIRNNNQNNANITNINLTEQAPQQTREVTQTNLGESNDKINNNINSSSNPNTSNNNLNVPPSSHNTPLSSPTTAQSSSALLSPMIIVNLMYPGPEDNNYNLVLYFVRRVKPAELLMKENNNTGEDGLDINRIAAFDRVLSQFLTDGNDEFRDSRFKIIPRIAKGSWIVQKGVGCTPAILGRKIKQTYHRDLVKNYIEIDADVGSSMIAGKILALVKGAATSLTIDLSFLFQGEGMDELPESMLGGVRLVHVDLGKILHVNENKDKNNMVIS